MEVEDAIKFLRNHFRIGIYEKKSLDIIALLKKLEKKSKRGKKYGAMWEELYAEYGMCPIRKNDEEGYMSNILYKILEELQRKYFPKITKVKNEKKA